MIVGLWPPVGPSSNRLAAASFGGAGWPRSNVVDVLFGPGFWIGLALGFTLGSAYALGLVALMWSRVGRHRDRP